MIGVSQLDDDQKAALETFAKNVEDCTTMERSETELLKWLVARNFDIEEAEKMFRRSWIWRQAFQVDRIVDWEPPEVLKKYYSIGKTGVDKHNCLLWIAAYGQVDMKGIIKSVGKKNYVQYIIYLAEMTKLDRRPDSYQDSFIIDMEHLSSSQLTFRSTREVGIEVTRLTEANYPESTRRVFVINVPQVFAVIWNMVKPFLHQITIDKVRIFGTDVNEWKAALLEEIDPDQLPTHYGGTQMDPDGNARCLTKVPLGGEVPKSYYLPTAKPVATKDMDALTIARGSKETIEFAISSAGRQLRWKFMTEEADIGFRIFIKSATGEEMDVVASQRIDSHTAMEEGAIICSQLCSYVVEFDNTFSYFRSKKIHYSIYLVKLDEY